MRGCSDVILSGSAQESRSTSCSPTFDRTPRCLGQHGECVQNARHARAEFSALVDRARAGGFGASPIAARGPDPRLGAEPLRRGWATSPASAPIRFCAFPAAASGPACPATCAKPTASSATTGNRRRAVHLLIRWRRSTSRLRRVRSSGSRCLRSTRSSVRSSNAAPPSRPARATVPDRRGQRDHPSVGAAALGTDGRRARRQGTAHRVADLRSQERAFDRLRPGRGERANACATRPSA